VLRSTIRNAISEAVTQAAMTKQAAIAKQAAAKQAAMAERAAMAKQAAAKQVTSQCPAAAAAPAVSTCLTKEYLDNGAMKFRDNCTGEWAQTPVTTGALLGVYRADPGMEFTFPIAAWPPSLMNVLNTDNLRATVPQPT
jgi:hypothetical protein